MHPYKLGLAYSKQNELTVYIESTHSLCKHRQNCCHMGFFDWCCCSVTDSSEHGQLSLEAEAATGSRQQLGFKVQEQLDCMWLHWPHGPLRILAFHLMIWFPDDWSMAMDNDWSVCFFSSLESLIWLICVCCKWNGFVKTWKQVNTKLSWWSNVSIFEPSGPSPCQRQTN